MIDYSNVLDRAFASAKLAAELADKVLPAENARGLDCGFAWVDILTPRDASDATKAFVKWCKATSNGRKRGYGQAAWQFWSPAHASTQSVSVHYAGARAFAKVLQDEGIKAIAGSRLD